MPCTPEQVRFAYSVFSHASTKLPVVTASGAQIQLARARGYDEIQIPFAPPASETVTEVQLEQNAPNPMSETSTLRYQLPQAGEVTVEVCDMMGNRVLVLVHARQSAGSYSLQVDGKGLTTGAYIARLRVVEESGNVHVKSVVMSVIK